MKLPRYWRYLLAVFVGLVIGAIVHGMLGVILGAAVAVVLIVIIEPRVRQPRLVVGCASILSPERREPAG